MQNTAEQIAALVNGTVDGDPSVQITHPAKIEEAGPGSITFLADPAYEHHLYGNQATAVLVSRAFTPKQTLAASLIRVDDVRAAVTSLLVAFQETEASRTKRATSAQAVVHESAQIGENVRIGKFSVVEAGAEIGDDTVILDQVYIGPGVKIGARCVLYPGTRVLRDCIIGNDCTFHSNVVIGSDGFGFAPQSDGTYKKVPQVGNVLIEDHVEIGACTVIDRATMGSTLIREGVKLDNLIQIGHNVEVDINTVIAAQAGIAGSAKIGKSVRIGGQVGIAGHLTIADGISLQAKSGVGGHLREEGQALMGAPALPYRDFQRSYVVFKQLPEVYRELARLKKEVEALKEK
ncbi:MAG: UDP-3-O-(3-hydroxymyristoyl)glucosamine N-acyltransferase [Bacteroidota bacterium]